MFPISEEVRKKSRTRWDEVWALPCPPDDWKPPAQNPPGANDDTPAFDPKVLDPKPPKGALTASPLRMLVTSLGVSTGDAFSVQFLNQGPTPITLPRGGLTLRPLKREAAERAMSEFKQLTGRLTTVKMDGYCLNYQKLAPRAGVVYAVAPRAMQERNVSVREVLRLVTLLNAYGLITPEGDRRTYLHSIRQWALWTREQKFTERSFTSAMLDHAKKNLADTKRRWTSDDEKFVRASAAKRWADVNTVLRMADKVAEVRKGQ